VRGGYKAGKMAMYSCNLVYKGGWGAMGELVYVCVMKMFFSENLNTGQKIFFEVCVGTCICIYGT